jgi:Transposase DDE domain group 1
MPGGGTRTFLELRGQRRPSSAPRARLQSRQFHEDAGDAQDGGAWSLTSLREKLIKIGAKVVSHGRYVTFQMAEVAVSRQAFADILSLIARLRAPPALA